ncbi:MAG TPA: histidine kinase [Bacteroidales bacterium]|mgnify:FL=1|nr:histidine kinase [Bacteroidales bacterium]
MEIKFKSIVLLSVWTIIIIVHTLFLYLTYQLTFVQSLADALVFNSIFALISFGLWFMTAFYDVSQRKNLDLLLNHAAACLITISAWISISVYALKSIFQSETTYVDFLVQSIPIRGIVGFLLYVGFVWAFYMVRMLAVRNWQIEQHEKLSQQLRDAQLKALTSQINPHFLFNSLNSIHALIMINSEKAGEMILKLSELMRYSFSKQQQMVSFNEEIQQVKRYLDIEKIRFSERLNVELIVDEDAKKAIVPSMILQPLVENAVKYGIYGVETEVLISISAEINDTVLNIKLVNNFDESVPVKHGTGMGLKNVNERLATLYFRNDLLRVEKKHNFFEVNLKIPQV